MINEKTVRGLEQMYTIPELAEILQLHPATVRRMFSGRQGMLRFPGRRSRYRIPLSLVREVLKEYGYVWEGKDG
jgi:hypothetical protein